MRTSTLIDTEAEPRIRPATIDDVPAILELIIELAVYEKEPDAVLTTEDDLRTALFGDTPHAFCHVADAPADSGRRIDGMALWFLTFSTWEGKHGIHLEDLYVREQARGTGLGLALIRALASTAVERGYKRLEWVCLKWNEPSLEFYRALGAERMDTDWATLRLDAERIAALAGE